MNTDPRHGFPTFGAAVRSQRIRTGAILCESRRGRDGRPFASVRHAVSRVLADRVARGEGTFTR